MRAPGLVARLMGLESMPLSKLNQAQKDPNPQFLPTEDTQPSKDICFEGPRPQKLQKTSKGSGDFIANSGPTHFQKSNHNSPCLSARSPRARLVQAAAKILEPGFRPQFALSPLNSSLRNVEEDFMVDSLVETKINSCTFSENVMETMVISAELQKVNSADQTQT
jgi:hypothetical protein